MKPELVAAREAVMTGERPWEIDPFYQHRNTLFTHHVAALLLMLCPNIEILKYEEGDGIIEDILRQEVAITTSGRCSLIDGYPIGYAKAIGEALYGHRASLCKIDIDIDEYISGDEQGDDGDGEEIEEWYNRDKWYHRAMEISTAPLTKTRIQSTREYGATIGSMHDFEPLTHLGIGIRGYVRGKVAQYDSQIDESLLSRRDRFPSLKELHGIDETIPITVSIGDPDNDEDQLWQPEISGEEWEEALS
ncbi:hypothetical protein F4824DRAFT_500831 [Ustulina deusta]|nr:hypothetical protein F4824DRAFT_500831 [Ustulina deusta]